MKIKNILGIPAVLFAVFVWGTSYVSTQIVLRDLPPVSIAFFRQFIALVPLLILMAVKKENFRIKKSEIAAFILTSLFGIVLYFCLENKGLTMISASSASMLAALVPILVLVAESIAGRKRIKTSSLLSIVISMAGVYLILFDGKSPDLGSDSFLGSLFEFGTVLSWVVYTFLSQRLGRSYSSLKMTTIQTIFSLPLFIPFVLNEVDKWKIPSPAGLLNLVFLGVFCSALAYVFYLFGLQSMGTVVSSALLNLIPLVTVAADSFILSVKLSSHQIAGAALIVGSLTYLSLRKPKQQVPSAACAK